MEENKFNIDQNKFRLYVCLFISTPVVIGFGSLYAGFDVMTILRNVIACIFSIGVVVLVMMQSELRHTYPLDNQIHPERFVITYVVSLLLMVFLNAFSVTLLPREVVFLFPYLSIAILLTLFSDFNVGLISYVHFILVSSMLCGFDVSTAFMYVLSGMIGCCLIRSAEKTFRIWRLIGIMMGQYVVLYVAYRLLSSKDYLYDLIWFGGGLLLNFIVLLLILYLADRKMIHKYDQKYDELNQPEHELLVQLKEKEKEDYMNAVHTAYLCEHLAQLIEADSKLAKAGGYYHKIGILRAKSYVAKSIEIGKEYDFPEPLLALLNEYTGRQDPPKTVEAVIVMLSEEIVKTITYMYRKDSEKKLDYDKIIEAIFKKKYDTGILKDSGISLKVFYQMKEYYQSEALYYDFLR